jgi:hypothetical protein
VTGRDITEGDGNVWALAPDGLPIARGTADIGIVSTDAIWQNTNISYDFAIGGMPFISAVTDKNEYLRETAPFKKDQFDNGQEPGEQSLTGWWLRSQMSFHGGAGIKFFDPATNDEAGQYRFADSQGVDVWTKGQVTLLKDVVNEHETTGPVTGTDHQHPNQHVRSIQWSGINGVLLHDEYDVDKIAADGTVTHFIDYNTGSAEPVRAICDDGVFAYWVTNAIAGGANKLHMYKKALTDNTTTIPSPMFTETGLVIQYAAMEFIKDRIILCVNNKVYELATTATALPSPVYTNSNTNYHYTSVAASGPAIYTAGHSGIYSTIQKYTLSTAGAMPTLTSAVVAAELPAGEIIEKIYYYLGYMCIGTNKGIRVALVNDQDGSLTYGPLIAETSQPVYDFAGRDHFVWAASGIGALDAGLIRLDLENEISTLRMAYANDLQVTQTTEHYTTGVAFIGATNRLAFCTAYNTTDGAIYLESESTLRESGYLTTGSIRYGTLEPKNFKRLIGRGDFSKGSLTLRSVDANNTEYEHVTYDSVVPSVEVGTNQPTTAVEYLAYKFVFRRDTTTTSTGPVFKGYQAKATIATPRQRIIQFPVYNFDVETDRNGVQVGYEDRAHDRLLQLELIEQAGDIILWQDLNTQELRQAQIEKIRFTKATPPSGKFSGSGGIIEIVIRTV